jgi:RNA polymerase sigma-70 factor (ECF subfamily)
MSTVDIATIHACQQGDPDAARRIYDALCDRVYSLAYRYTNDADRALDLAQEVFLNLFSRISSFRGDASLETWVYRVAVNTIIDELRRDRWCDGLPNQLADKREATKPEQQLAGRELGAHIAQAVADLPESLRIVFVLAGMEGLAYREAAELLDLSVEAVRMRMSRARARLRQRLGPYLEQGDDRGL